MNYNNDIDEKSQIKKENAADNLTLAAAYPQPTDAMLIINEYCKKKHIPFTQSWRYRDINGKDIFYVYRIEYPKQKKQILPFYVSIDGQVINARPALSTHPIYNIQSINDDEKILIVEGEKAADIIVEGYTVLTWLGGTSQAGKPDWTILKNRDVTICPDNDEPGRIAAAEIKKQLPQAKILDIPKTKFKSIKGWDIADADGIDLVEFIKNCPIAETTNTNENANTFKSFTAVEILNTTFPEIKFIIPGIIPQGLTLLAGTPKIGKSWLCLDIATTLSTGGYILNNVRVNPATTLYLCLEDNKRRLQNRMIKQASNPGDNCHFMTETDGTGVLQLHNWMQEHPDTELIIIDTLSRFMEIKDSNDYTQTTKALASIKTFADEYEIAVIVVHHAKKAETPDFVHSVIGSTGIAGAVDTILILARKRGQVDAKFSITGRDIEEQEFAMSFNPDCCRWSIIGDAKEYAESKERQDILDILKSTNQPMKPADIAAALEKNPGSIRFLLMKMKDAGQILNPVYGKYMCINANTTNNANITNTTNTANTLQGKSFTGKPENLFKD